MSKKKKVETITVMSGYDKALSERERFNPYQTGTGEVVSEKYKGRKGRKAQRDKKELWEVD